jgi:phage terminase small subunit
VIVGRVRSPNRDKAKRMYLESKGKMKLKDIAEKLGVLDTQIRKWKSTDKWDKELKGTLPKKKSNVTNKKETKKSESINKTNEENETALDIAELTEKQRLFAEIYVKNFNATQAAIKAGYAVDSAFMRGHELVRNSKVRGYINYLKELKKESIMADIDDIVELKMRIAFSDMTDFIQFGQERVPIISSKGPITYSNPVTGEKEVLTQVVNTAKLKESWEVDGGLIKEIKVNDQGASIKLEDRDKAQDWLANYFIMNPMDKHKIEYDNARLELERKKAELAALKSGEDPEEETEDDGFIEALKATAQEDWSDEED